MFSWPKAAKSRPPQGNQDKGHKDGDRTHLFDDQAGRNPAQPDRRDHQDAGRRRPARRRLQARLDEPPRGRRLLRRPQGPPVLRRTGRVHVVRPDHRAGSGRRERHRQEPRSDGRDQPGQRRRRHDPQGARPVDRRELGARLGRAGNRCGRDRLLVLRHRNRRLI